MEAPELLLSIIVLTKLMLCSTWNYCMKKVVLQKCICSYGTKKRDVSGITPLSVASDAVDIKFTSTTVHARVCYGVDALDKYCANVVSILKTN